MLRCVITFLNDNSSAIQVLVTAALVVTTIVYVRLTARLSRAAESQIRYENAAKRTRWFRLDIILEKILLVLENCPKPPTDVWIRTVPIWTNNDLTELQRLASEFFSSSQSTADLMSSLQRIKSIVDEIRRIPPLQGYDWRKFPNDEWEGRVVSAISHVQAIKSDMNQYLRGI